MCEFLNLAEDGAMIDDVATEELARLGRDNEDPGIILTLTAGGNDLLDALAAGRKLESAVSLAARRYSDLVETVRDELPARRWCSPPCTIPPMGPAGSPDSRPTAACRWSTSTASTNRSARSPAPMPSVVLAEVHRHFLGHGVTAPEQERWYWRRNLIEPNARGASEIRRVWWEAVEGI